MAFGEHPIPSEDEMIKRLIVVEDWLIYDELRYSEIMRRGAERWNCSERTVRRYIRRIRDAYEETKERARRSGLLRRTTAASLRS